MKYLISLIVLVSLGIIFIFYYDHGCKFASKYENEHTITVEEFYNEKSGSCYAIARRPHLEDLVVRAETFTLFSYESTRFASLRDTIAQIYSETYVLEQDEEYTEEKYTEWYNDFVQKIETYR